MPKRRLEIKTISRNYNITAKLSQSIDINLQFYLNHNLNIDHVFKLSIINDQNGDTLDRLCNFYEMIALYIV